MVCGVIVPFLYVAFRETSLSLVVVLVFFFNVWLSCWYTVFSTVKNL